MVDSSRVVKACQRRSSLAPSLAIAVTAWIGVYGSPSSRAEFILLDNFSSGTVGGSLSTSNAAWSTVGPFAIAVDPTNAANKVAAAVQAGTANNQTAFLPFGVGNVIADGATGTVFFRMMRGPTAATNFLGYVNSGASAGTAFADRRSGIGSNGGSTQPMVMRGGSNTTVTTSGFTTLAQDTWYRYWVVMNNSDDTFVIYSEREGSSPLAQTLLSNSAGSTQTFISGSTTNALQSLFFAQSSSGGNMDFYFDDIYVDPTAANLAMPPIVVPEPAALLAAAAGLGLAAGFLRRFAAGGARSINR